MDQEWTWTGSGPELDNLYETRGKGNILNILFHIFRTFILNVFLKRRKAIHPPSPCHYIFQEWDGFVSGENFYVQAPCRTRALILLLGKIKGFINQYSMTIFKSPTMTKNFSVRVLFSFTDWRFNKTPHFNNSHSECIND